MTRRLNIILLTSLLVFVFAMNLQAQINKRKVAIGDTTYQSLCDSLTNLADKEYYSENGSLREAWELYRKAYKLGGVKAAFILGDYYEYGVYGVCEEDLEKAYNLWEEAANAGYGIAAYKLGQSFIYYTKTVDRGVYWMEKADSLGYVDAAMTLGQLYGIGYYLPKDYDKSLYYYTHAADRGVAEAQEFVGIEYFNGKNVKRNMVIAAKYLTAAANQQQAKAAYYAALCTEKGWGVVPDDVMAAYYYMVAADGEIPQAQYRLSQLYTEGNGVQKNPRRAAYWMEQAKKNGYTPDSPEP